jgi:two-component system alkaline phosphatase synthesis response regulator PhoP/two-component system response regulator ResD
MGKETILVVDDERNIVELARMYLESDGYRVETAGDGAAALERARALKPALVILDLMLPIVDGWEVCRRLRTENDVPIVMLTARSDDVDKIVGLEIGADDYLTKPFNPRELVARVKAILRRSQRAAQPGKVLTFRQVTIDSARREVMVLGRLVDLRAREFDLLYTLAEHRGLVLSREQLLDQVWGFEFFVETRTVDVHIARLREKLKDSGLIIETVWGIGYKLVDTYVRLCLRA